MIASIASRAAKWVAIWSSLSVASKRETRSAEDADLHAEAAYQFQHPAIDQRDVHDVVVRRVLHGDAPVRLEHRGELFMQLAPSAVVLLHAGQRGEMPGLDAMIQLYRLARRRE